MALTAGSVALTLAQTFGPGLLNYALYGRALRGQKNTTNVIVSAGGEKA